ncbi:hypothetical protein ABBQ32_004856 [Trebouxia sp. C0010 RCD-2024]
MVGLSCLHKRTCKNAQRDAGVTALRVHRSLQPRQRSSSKPSVTICRDVPYATKPRTVMDIYVPSQTFHPPTSTTQQAIQNTAKTSGHHVSEQGVAESKQLPVALFCHGGVWATGAKWHYAPMAKQVAQAGVLTCVLQYSLYPDALAPQMVDELSQALTWTFNNISQHGGNPNQVSLVGHSAGAQMCAMALLHRAKALSKYKQSHEGSSKSGQGLAQDTQLPAHVRMPANFIGMAGVYDIETHYQYEYGRGVAELSTMKRAMGGRLKFPTQSPALILNAACGGKAQVKLPGLAESPAGGSGWGGRLAALGKAVQGRLPGFMAAPSVTTPNPTASRPPANPPAQAVSAPLNPAPAAVEPVMPFTLQEAEQLPPVTLMSSTADIIVPWHQSEEFHQVLQACSLATQHRVYHDRSHAGFVIDWTGPPLDSQEGWQNLSEYKKDLICKIRSPC